MTGSTQSNTRLVIRGWQKTGSGPVSRISASLDGHEMYFQGAAMNQAPERSDAFLATGLLSAMQHNRALDLTMMPPLSAGILENLEKIQDIWCSWNHELKRIPVLAREESNEPGIGNVTFFSGGVNAVQAVLEQGDEAGRLVMVKGFDFGMSDEVFAASQDRARKLSAHLGHEFETVETNWMEHTRRQRIAPSTSHGVSLAAVAHLLHPARATIASTYSWACTFPWGTHPLLDHFWSSDSLKILRSRSDLSRLEKMANIAKRPDLLQQLCVCHQNPLSNCGKCAKCLRAMAMLKLANGDMSAFPPFEGDVVAEWMKNSSDEEVYLHEIVCYAHATGNTALAERVEKGRRAAQSDELLKRLARLLNPGRALRREQALDLRPWGHSPRPELL